mmetsp:Transcript_33864/g.50223  ORF Transcript_33864/g.50223 Transcript_33864/m.50223 type:complete len:128 (+) Transcript_33864:37-420(+)
MSNVFHGCPANTSALRPNMNEDLVALYIESFDPRSQYEHPTHDKVQASATLLVSTASEEPSEERIIASLTPTTSTTCNAMAIHIIVCDWRMLAPMYKHLLFIQYYRVQLFISRLWHLLFTTVYEVRL